MWFSLLICTYNRSNSLIRLLKSVEEQFLYPNEILIIDASEGQETKLKLEPLKFKNLKYFRVQNESKGLTKQRNFGLDRISKSSQIVCFLDDDIILEKEYFQNLIGTYEKFPQALGVGGFIQENIKWIRTNNNGTQYNFYQFDGYKRPFGSRYLLRKILGLLPDKRPGFMPEFSHGYPIAFLPPSSKIYPVEYFMGGVSSYKTEIFDKLSFSERFAGYGLYEDMDFCLRLSLMGELFVNTSAKVQHLHEESGRPDYFKYGKMMIENGHYVWKLKNQNSALKSVMKWYLINLVLIGVRLTNILNDKNRSRPFFDVLGRLNGLYNVLTK